MRTLALATTPRPSVRAAEMKLDEASRKIVEAADRPPLFDMVQEPAEPPPPPKPKRVIPADFEGLVEDLPADEYHADPCERPSLSASIAKVLDRSSPLHAWAAHPRFGGRAPVRESKALARGTLLHALLLGESDRIEVVHADDWRTKAAKAARADANAWGRIPTLVGDLERTQVVADAITERLDELGLVLVGASEVTMFWLEEADDGTRVQCRGRIDHLRGTQVYDLKSAASAHPDAIQRQVDALGYAIQRAAYVSGLERVLNAPGRVEFTFIFAELEAPFVVTPVRLNGEFRALGERRWRRAVNLWARCVNEGNWPSYADRVLELAPPRWAMANELERDAMEGA